MVNKNPDLFGITGELAPYHFLYGASIVFNRNPEGDSFRVRLKDYMLKDEESEGLIVENLVLSIVNPGNSLPLTEVFTKGIVIIEYFSVIVSERWVNHILRTAEREALPEEVNKLRISFRNNMISMHGAYKKGLNFGFTVEILLKVINDRIVVDLERFWAGKLPMPQLLQKTLLNFMQNYLTSNKQLISGVRFFDRNIFLDHLALISAYIPVPIQVYTYVRNVHIDDGFLVIQGGADFQEALHIALQKKEEVEKASLLMDSQTLIKDRFDEEMESTGEDTILREVNREAPEVSVRESETLIKLEA